MVEGDHGGEYAARCHPKHGAGIIRAATPCSAVEVRIIPKRQTGGRPGAVGAVK